MKGKEGTLSRKWRLRRGSPGAGKLWKALGRSLALFGGSFLLSAMQFRGQSLPAAACLSAAVPLGLGSVAAACGAVAGYLVFAGGTGCLELLALSVLELAAVTVFQGTPLSSRRWFMPALSAALCAVLKSIELCAGEVAFALWLLHWLLGGAFSALFSAAANADSRARLGVLGAMVCSLGCLPIKFPLGLFCAVGLCVAVGSWQVPAVLGIALEVSTGGGAAALMLPAVLFSRTQSGKPRRYACLYALSCLSVLLLLGDQSVQTALAVLAGAFAGELLHTARPFPVQTEPPQAADGTRLRMAAELMELLRRQLPEKQELARAGEAERVFDGAAERICRCCERFHRCWQNRGAETYEALSRASGTMLLSGMLHADDLDPAFRDRCCHLEGFLTAVNQELEGMLFRRRYRYQLEESRQVVAGQMECMAEYLRQVETPRKKLRAAYLPRVGISAVGKGGASSGDRGACFPGGDTDYYVLLCDGMGTGGRARQLCGQTLRLLERLLRGGLPPESALRLLNGIELLRQEERYTTVDLLHIFLQSGQAELFKWGSAPSYWRAQGEVRKIGTAAPPPGVGTGMSPERYELSLKEGEILVLTSDGAAGEETQSTVAMYSGNSPQELAALLISGSSDADDRSAVVISLTK